MKQERLLLKQDFILLQVATDQEVKGSDPFTRLVTNTITLCSDLLESFQPFLSAILVHDG